MKRLLFITALCLLSFRASADICFGCQDKPEYKKISKNICYRERRAIEDSGKNLGKFSYPCDFISEVLLNENIFFENDKAELIFARNFKENYYQEFALVIEEFFEKNKMKDMVVKKSYNFPLFYQRGVRYSLFFYLDKNEESIGGVLLMLEILPSHEFLKPRIVNLKGNEESGAMMHDHKISIVDIKNDSNGDLRKKIVNEFGELVRQGAIGL